MTDLATIEDWHFWFAGRDALVLALLERYRAHGVLVDAGCGTGAFAARLASEPHLQVVALDHHAPARAQPAAAGVADVERLPLRTGAASVLLARDVLEHVDDERALAECRRVLAPGGLLIALVPAWPSLWSERDAGAGHLRRYTRRTLRTVLERTGFRVDEVRGYQFALLPAIAASRVLSRRRPATVLRAEERPAPKLNRALSAINRAEAGLATRRRPCPPTGSTLVVVAHAG